MAGNSLSEPLVIYQEWRISKAKYQFKQRNRLDSDIYEFKNANWFLRIYPRGRMSDGIMSLYLYREGFESEHVFFRIGMKGRTGESFIEFDMGHTFTVGSNSWGYDDFLLYRDFGTACRSMLTNEGTLTIFCIIHVAVEPTSTNYESRTPESEGTVPLTEDHVEMYLERIAKVEMTVNGREFLANPKLLVERSRFFATKLKESMTWMHGIPIEIDGCDPETFDQFLLFLLNRNVTIVTSNNMMGLYKNSSVWEIPELKSECIRRMELELSLDTFCDIHYLSIVKNETDLQNSVAQFFISNVKSILVSDKWQEHLKSNHLMCNELYLKYLSSIRWAI